MSHYLIQNCFTSSRMKDLCHKWKVKVILSTRAPQTVWWLDLTHQSSLSSSSSAPISEHIRRHKLSLTPLWTILCTHPRCVETKVVGLKVELDCTEPRTPWSTCPASPIRWNTNDGCSKDARVVLWWVGSRKMSEQTSEWVSRV